MRLQSFLELGPRPTEARLLARAASTAASRHCTLFGKILNIFEKYYNSSEASVSKRFNLRSCHSAWPLAGLKIKTNSLCSPVTLIVFFKFLIENAGGDNFNQFLIEKFDDLALKMFRSKRSPKNIGGST